MSTYEFQTFPATARSLSEVPAAISEGIDSLGSLGLADENDLAEIHVLLSGQHGGYDIEFIYAVEED